MADDWFVSIESNVQLFQIPDKLKVWRDCTTIVNDPLLVKIILLYQHFLEINCTTSDQCSPLFQAKSVIKRASDFSDISALNSVFTQVSPKLDLKWINIIFHLHTKCWFRDDLWEKGEEKAFMFYANNTSQQLKIEFFSISLPRHVCFINLVKCLFVWSTFAERCINAEIVWG